jgi:predicted nucleic acid-binding protein
MVYKIQSNCRYWQLWRLPRYASRAAGVFGGRGELLNVAKEMLRKRFQNREAYFDQRIDLLADALDVALAEQMGYPLITADEVMIKKLREHCCAAA